MVLLPSEPTVNSQESDLQSLRSLVRELADRVERLERRLGDEGAAAETVLRAETPLSSAPPPPPPSQPVANTPLVFPAPSSPAPQFAAAAPQVDLESRIGSHWLNRIGISAVLIGVSYFLKFAFDNNWIGPTGRVTIGLLAGIAVMVWSESFRRRDYKIFSYSLKAVGV
jgi:uncharacterized membrane protein